MNLFIFKWQSSIRRFSPNMATHQIWSTNFSLIISHDSLCAITKFLLLETFFAFQVLLVWYKLSIQFFVMLKTWQFSQKKISKNNSKFTQEKIISQKKKKKKKFPKKFPNLFVDKTTKLVTKKKSLVQYQTNMLVLVPQLRYF